MTGATTIPGPRLAFFALGLISSAPGLGPIDTSNGGSTAPDGPGMLLRLVDRRDNNLRTGFRLISSSGDFTLVPGRGAEQVDPVSPPGEARREGTLPLGFPLRSSLSCSPEGIDCRAVVGAATETKLEVQSLTFGKLAIPLESLTGLVFEPPVDEDASFELVNRVRTEAARVGGVVWLAPNGDRVRGFLGARREVVEVSGEYRPPHPRTPEVVALGFDGGLVSYPKPDGPFLNSRHPTAPGWGDEAEDRTGRGRCHHPLRYLGSTPLNDLIQVRTR